MKKKNANKQEKQEKGTPVAHKRKGNNQGSSFWKNKTQLMHVAILLLVTILVFSGSLKNGFVNWDDEPNLLENPNMTAFNWNYIKHIFTDRVIGNYNPLPIFTFAIEHAIFGFEPFIYHLDNLILHLICTFLVYRIFISLRFAPVAALIGALLFGIHPMKVESVAWVTERKDVLFGVFYLWALLLYIKNKTADSPKTSTNIAIAVLFILALFSKIQAVSLPLTMIVIDYYLQRSFNWKMVLNKAPYFIFSLAFGLAGIYFLAEQQSLDQLPVHSFVERLLVGSKAYMLYLIKFVAPYEMSPMYPYTAKLAIEYYLAPIGVIAVALLTFVAWKKNIYWLVTGIGIFTVNVMFLLQIVGAGQGLFADRFTYIPYIGIGFLVVYGIDYIVHHKQNILQGVYIFCGVYLVFFAWLSWRQIGIWENGGTLWTHVLKYYPNATTPWQNRGRYYRNAKQYDKALADLTAALKLNSDLGVSYNSRAKIYFDLQKYREAINDYDSAIVFAKLSAEALINRGVSHCALNELEAGVADINQGLSLNPELRVLKNGYSNLALAYGLMQQYENSDKTYDKLISLDPGQSKYWYEKALCQRHLNNEKEAIQFLTKAIETGASGTYYYERAKCWHNLGDKAKRDADIATSEKYGIKAEDYLKQ